MQSRGWRGRSHSVVEIGISLGRNIGDKAAMIRRAGRELEASGEIYDLVLSPLYRTAPWGNVDQDWFVNACAVARTALAPEPLLRLFQACELRLGRERVVHWGPRTIDIDLLYYDDLALDDPDLTVPHREMLNRAFVLVPLAELRPDRVVRGVRVADAAERIGRDGMERL